MAPRPRKQRKPATNEPTQRPKGVSKANPGSDTAHTFQGHNNIRANDTHIFFWSGILSNWHQGEKFSGARCFELLLPELEALRASSHDITYPDPNAFSTRLLKSHSFDCGEQWMMAVKGWFFERDIELSEWIVEAHEEPEFQQTKTQMFQLKMQKEWAEDSREAAMWESTLCSVLRSKKPRQQKSFGRQTRGFIDETWALVSVPCVFAACVARAEEDPGLRNIYLSSGKREFVEGSPFDTVWGVGIHWKKAEIEDPTLWTGQNRLGECHNLAARKVQEMFKGVDEIDADKILKLRQTPILSSTTLKKVIEAFLKLESKTQGIVVSKCGQTKPVRSPGNNSDNSRNTCRTPRHLLCLWLLPTCALIIAVHSPLKKGSTTPAHLSTMPYNRDAASTDFTTDKKTILIVCAVGVAFGLVIAIGIAVSTWSMHQPPNRDRIVWRGYIRSLPQQQQQLPEYDSDRPDSDQESVPTPQSSPEPPPAYHA